MSVQPGWGTQRVIRHLRYKERLSQKLKKGEEEGRMRKGEEGKKRGKRKKGAMGRVKGMCLTW